MAFQYKTCFLPSEYYSFYLQLYHRLYLQKLNFALRQKPTLPCHEYMTLQSDIKDYVKTKFESFKNDAYASLKELTVDKFLDYMGELKPINLALIISNFASARSWAERQAIMMALSELCGDFWKGDYSWKLLILQSLVYVISYICRKCWSSVRDVIGSQDEEFMELQSIEITENGLLDKVLKLCKLDKVNFKMTEEHSFLVTVCVILLVIVTGGSIASITSNSLNKMIKRLSKTATTIKSIHNLQEYLPKVWDNCLEAVGSLFGFTHTTDDSEVTDLMNRLIAYKTRVLEYKEMTKHAPWKILQDPNQLKEIIESLDELDKCYLEISKAKKNTASTKPIIDEIKEIVRNLREYTCQVKNSSSVKQEPFLMMISGRPGIGKSRLIDALVKRLSNKIGVQPTTYNRNSTVKHWDNYCGQSYVIYDDFGAIKTDLDHADIMSYKNPSKTILPMADISDKGCQFSSIGVIAASNENKINSSAVVKCSEALERRMEIKVKVVDPNFDEFIAEHRNSPGDFQKNTGKIPKVRLDNGQEVDYFDNENFTHLQFFREPSYLMPQAEGVEITFGQLVDLCSSFYDVYRDAFTTALVTPVVNETVMTVDEANLHIHTAVEHVVAADVPLVQIDETTEIGEVVAAGNLAVAEKIDDDIVSEPETVSTASSSGSRKKWTYDEAMQYEKVNEAHNLVYKTNVEEAKKRLAAGQINVKDFVDLNVPMETKINWISDLDRIKKTMQEKKEFIKNRMKEGRNRHQAERDYADFYNATMGARPKERMKDQSIEAPFVDVERPKCPIILLSGDPGTGKSFTQSALIQQSSGTLIHGSDLSAKVIPPGILFVEDASVDENAFKHFEQYVCKVYDGASHITGIVASVNPSVMDHWFVNEEARNRFYRRVDLFDYRWQLKERKIFSKDIYYTAEELESGSASHAQAVCIRSNKFTGRIDFNNVLNYALKRLSEARQVSVPLAVSVPYIGNANVVPEFIVEISSLTMEEAFKAYYANPKKMAADLLTGKVSLKKGSFLDGVKIANSFGCTNSKGARIEWPGSLDQFIILVNNTGITSEKVFTTQINAKDCSLMITPATIDPKRVLMFRMDPNVLVTDDCQRIIVDGEVKQLNPPSQQTYRSTVISEEVQKLVYKTEEVTEKIGITSQILSFFKEMPILKTISGILIFVLQISVAGLSIATLLKAGKARYQRDEAIIELGRSMEMEPEGRKKNSKGQMKLASRTRNFTISKQLYDDIGKTIRHVNPSAKNMKVKDLIDCYLDYWDAQDFDGYDRSSYVLSTDDIGIFFKGIQLETREEKVVIAKPTPMVLNNPYAVEASLNKYKPPFRKFVLTRIPKVEKDVEPVVEKKKREVEPMYNEALFDPAIRNMIDIAEKHDVEIYREGQDSMACHGVMIHGKVGITVNHVVSEKPLYVKTFLGPNPQKFPIKIVKQYPKLDMAIFKIDHKSAPTYKTIVHLFQIRTPAVQKAVENRSGVLVIVEHDVGSKTILPVKIQGVSEICTPSGQYTGIKYNNPVNHLAGAMTTHPINTQAGDCGSLLIVNDKTIQHKFLGIHHAGNELSAHAAFVYQDMFNELMKLEMQDSSKCVINPHHDMEIAEITRESLLGMPIAGYGDLQVHRPTTTQLWTSPLALPNSDGYQPSILNAYDTRNQTGEDPYYTSVAKWNNPQPVIDEALVDSCIEDIGYWYGRTIKNRQVQTKVLTKTEAINAGKNHNVNPINRKSAAGYPWSRYGKKEDFLINKGNGNEAYFGIDLQKKCGQKLNASIDFLINTCRTPNQHVAIPFSGWLKDEPLKMSKIESANTRSFAGAPFDYTIAYRMYFATIYGAIHEVRDKMPIQVGINPTSMEWDFMTRRLLSCSPSGFDLDFKGFDSKVPAVIQKKLVGIHNKIAQMTDPNWKTEDDLVRAGLHQALVKPLLVCPVDDTTYILQAPGGQPSGHPGTADDNSLIHLVYLMYAFKKVMIAQGYPELATLMHFMDKIQAIIYGDDGVYMVAPEIQSIFNFETVEVVMRELGNECTPAAKNGKIQKIIPLTACEFLKREFKQLGKYWFGPLKLMSFQKMLAFCLGPAHHWYKDKRPYMHRPADLKATADSCLAEATFHGKEFFNKMSDHLVSKLADCDIDYFPFRYADVVARLELPLPL